MHPRAAESKAVCCGAAGAYGSILFALSSDGKTFTGRYDNGEYWNGRRVAEDERHAFSFTDAMSPRESLRTIITAANEAVFFGNTTAMQFYEPLLIYEGSGTDTRDRNRRRRLLWHLLNMSTFRIYDAPARPLTHFFRIREAVRKVSPNLLDQALLLEHWQWLMATIFLSVAAAWAVGRLSYATVYRMLRRSASDAAKGDASETAVPGGAGTDDAEGGADEQKDLESGGPANEMERIEWEACPRDILAKAFFSFVKTVGEQRHWLVERSIGASQADPMPPGQPNHQERFMSPSFFNRYIGIDYSGAETPDSSLKGLRVYEAGRKALPMEIEPPPSPRKYWTRRGLAEWLADHLSDKAPAIVGIDHGFSFPLRYFEAHHLAPDWSTFLDDFQQHWPTDQEHTYVDFIRNGLRGNGAARSGSARWRRITEERAGAKSVFHFDVPGSVAKSTHAGLPWLRYLRYRLEGRVHFWPFDGWEIPTGSSVLAEVYPSLWRKGFPREDRTPDQHDAFVAAAWLRQADLDGRLRKCFSPPMLPGEDRVARVEGWILGVL
jgi:hypothetical protein